MKRYKRIAMLLLCMLTVAMPLLSCVPTTAFAQAVPEEGQKGSITVTVRNGEKAVPDGTLTLYRVGEVHEDDGNYSFVPTGKFTAWGSDFGDIASASACAATANSLAEFITKNKDRYNLTGITKTISQDGTVTFLGIRNDSGLEAGLYLLIQNDAASGYSAVSPFLVSIPYKGEYHVTPITKTELKKEPEPAKPLNTTTSSNPGTKLPQTGQLNWPVPVLAILGMTLFAVGWMLRFRKRDDNAQ